MMERARIRIDFKLSGKRSESVVKRKLYFVQKTIAGQIRDRNSDAFFYFTDRYKCNDIQVNEYPFTLEVVLPNKNCSKYLKNDCDNRSLVRFVEGLKVPVSEKWRITRITYEECELTDEVDNLDISLERVNTRLADDRVAQPKASVSGKRAKKSSLSSTEKVAESSKLSSLYFELYSLIKSSLPFDFVRTFLANRKKLHLTQLRDDEGYSILYRVVEVGQCEFFIILVKLGSFTDLMNLDEVHNGITVRELARKKHLEEELDLHVRWENSLHAIHKVCRLGIIDEIRSILKSNPTLKTVVDNSGCSVLHWASCAGITQILDLLHEHGITSSVLNVKNETALHWAASFGHHNIVKTLIQKFNVDPMQRDCEQRTVLEITAENGDVNFLQELIKWGGRLECTVLPISAQWGRVNYFHHVIKKLDIYKARDTFGKTALIAAAYSGVDVLVSLILDKYEVELGDTDYQGRTALHWASKNGHFNTVKLLTDKAMMFDKLTTIIDVKDRFSEEEFCVSLPFSEGSRSGWHYAMISKGLLNTFVKESAADQLELVKSYGKIIITSWEINARESLRKNRKPGALAKHGPADATPLHLALLYRHTTIAKHLIECGSGINIEDCFGLTPLHLCCSTGNVDMAVLLDSKGACWNKKNTDGQTPEDLAKINGHFAFMSCVGFAQQAQKFLGGTIADLMRDLAVETIQKKIEDGFDTRRYITDTLRHLVIKTNQALFDLGPGPILEEVGNGRYRSQDDLNLNLQLYGGGAQLSQMAVSYP